MSEHLETIVALSHEFGTTDYVQGGGGNSSAKNVDTLWVKPSGTTLCGLEVNQLLELDRERIARLYDVTPPEDVNEREAMVTGMLAETRRRADASGRPSVESPLHNSFEGTYVVHTHPQLVGGMVCARDSVDVAARLFPEHLYTPIVDPGYSLCMQIREALIAWRRDKGCDPGAVFMENHGVVVAGNTAGEIRELMGHIMESLRAEYAKAGIATQLEIGPEPSVEHVEEIVATVKSACDPEHTAHWVASGLFPVALGPLSPDHIVYMKSYPFVGMPDGQALQDFVARHGYSPRAVTTDSAVVCFGSTEKNAQLAMDMARDGAVVTQLAEAFGGARFMNDERRAFIENWEAETYRQKVASS